MDSDKAQRVAKALGLGMEQRMPGQWFWNGQYVPTKLIDLISALLDEWDALRAELAAAKAEVERLRLFIGGALYELKRSRVFVVSREKIKEPEGRELYDEFIASLQAVYEETQP